MRLLFEADLSTAKTARGKLASFSLVFLRAKAAMLSARLSHRNSVRLSVRLSVCLSHGWIRQKRSKLGSPNLHHWLPGRL